MVWESLKLLKQLYCIIIAIDMNKISTAVADVIHSRIELSPLEQSIIDHEYFQRLRRIKQLGFLSYVFPNANHTRFEHSLGAMHVAGQFWKALLRNTNDIILKYSSNVSDRETERRISWAKKHVAKLSSAKVDDNITKILRTAALTHDLGHGPFSHSFDAIMPQWNNLNGKKKDFPIWIQSKDKTQQVSHEVYSIVLLNGIFQNIRVMNELPAEWRRQKEVLLRCIAYLIGSSSESISEQEFGSLVGQSDLPAGILEILKALISGIIDVDRMDYLHRDSYHAGVKYGVFDIDRLKDSLVMWPDSEKRVKLALRYGGISAFEHYLFCLYQMYVQIYGHKTENACNAMLLYLQRSLGENLNKKLRPFLSSASGYSALDDNVYVSILGEVSKGDTKSRRLFKDLFYKRALWKRIVEIKPDRDAIGIDQVERCFKKIKVPYEKYPRSDKGRSILKGLSQQGKADSLLVVNTEMKFGGPELKNLRTVSDLAKLYDGKAHKVVRFYVPQREENKAQSAMKSFLQAFKEQASKASPSRRPK